MEDIDRPSWDYLTLADAYLDQSPTQYVVDKFFATHSLNVVYGAPGSLKSMIMADLCAAVVAGMDWLPGSNGGGQGVMTVPTATLWLDMDNGARRTSQRFGALARSRKLPETCPLFYVSMPNPPFFANDVDCVAQLMQDSYQNKFGLIVVDNLGLVTGDVEENSAGMAGIMGHFRTLAERTGAAVVLIHHQRKGGAAGSRPGDALRGHSSIEAAVDLALHVVRPLNSSEVSIQSTKTRGVDVPPLAAKFNFEHRPGTNDLHLAWFSGVKAADREDPIRAKILHLLDSVGAMKKGDLIIEVRQELDFAHGIGTIRQTIDFMVETHEISESTGPYNSKMLQIA